MNHLLFAGCLAALLFSACTREESLAPAERPDATIQTESGTFQTEDSLNPAPSTFTHESSNDYDSFYRPRLFSSVPGSRNRSLWGPYDTDYTAFQAVAGTSYTITLSNLNTHYSLIHTVRLEGYLPDRILLFRAPDGALSARFTATQSVMHTIALSDRNSQLNSANQLGDYTITVTADGSTQPIPMLTELTLSAASVKGGTPVTGTVRLAAPAPVGGVRVTLSSGAGAGVPSPVTIPEGSSSQAFTITTQRPAQSPQLVTITATSGTQALTAGFTITRR